ncbi:CC_3452 family protein [Parasphingorhabdus sp.]|uniref:CC_3452 family protein n=1 Tax=Parasphingorhabdus sp. TaxID=2709688 RepID=UPI002F93943B
MFTPQKAPDSSNLAHITVALIVALAAAMFVFIASPAEARSKPVAYTAELQQPVEESRFIIKGTVIYCAGTECKGAKGHSSVKTMCAKLAKEVGPIVSFSYKGEVIDSDALSECNA